MTECNCKRPTREEMTDQRMAVALSDAGGWKTNDTEFKRVWRLLFSHGLVNSLTPPGSYEINGSF